MLPELDGPTATGCASRQPGSDPGAIPAEGSGIGIPVGDLDRGRAETRGETGAVRAPREAPPRGGVGLLPLVLTAAVVAAPGVP